MNKKNITLLTILILAVLLGALFIFMNRKEVKVQTPAASQEVEVKKEIATEAAPSISALDEITPVQVLKLALSQEQYDLSAWTEKSDNKDPQLVTEIYTQDTGTASIQLQSNAQLIDSGYSADKSFFAAIMQVSEEETPKSDYPENDNFTCSLILLQKLDGHWKNIIVKKLVTFEYEGGTRYAKSCDGFKLSWDNTRPIFSRTETYGPYAGGEFTNTEEKVIWIPEKSSYELIGHESEASEPAN